MGIENRDLIPMFILAKGNFERGQRKAASLTETYGKRGEERLFAQKVSEIFHPNSKVTICLTDRSYT